MMKLRLDYIFYHALGLINLVEIYYQPLHMVIFELIYLVCLPWH